MENRRKFLDEMAIKLNINKSSDWGKVSVKQIHEFGGSGILNYYKHSVLHSLQLVYKGKLQTLDNERNFMEKGLVSSTPSSSEIILAINRKSQKFL